MRSRFFSIAARISSARPAASNISQAARSFATASFIRGDAITSAFQAYSGNGYQKNYGQWILGGLIPAAALASQIPTVEGAEMERTFIAIKPDGVQRGLISEIVSRFERKGYKLVAIKLVVPTKEFAQKHYDDLKGRPFFDGLCTFLSSGPVVAMVWEGQGVIKYGRKLIGATSPQVSEPGTIRGDLAISVGRNIIHGSDGPETAKAEIELWFKPEELISYGLISEKWLYES